MNYDGIVIELLAEMLLDQKVTNLSLDNVNKRLEKLEDQQAKTNLGIGELRLSVKQLSEKLTILADHENRIDKLEHTVYH